MISPKERAAEHMLDIKRGCVGVETVIPAGFRGTSKSCPWMGGKRPRQSMPPPRATMKGPKLQHGTLAKTSQRVEKTTVTINTNLLQCCVCFGSLTPPLFQCTKGHVSCSGCCTTTDGYVDDEIECLMCREPETATRCHAMEHLLAGLQVPCPFRRHGCAEMIPYASRQAHEASCAHATRHCPISGCAGYRGKPLREHVRQDHPGVARTVVSPCCLTPLKMQADERARVVRLAGGGGGGSGSAGAEFLVIVGKYKELGRALSVVRLVDEYVFKQDFKHRIEVIGKTGVLSLSGETLDAERLDKPYEANPFLFVPNETWDSPEDIPVFIQLK